MAYGTPRPPVSERLRQSAQNPFVAALLGGGVVLIAVLILAAAGVIGGSDSSSDVALLKVGASQKDLHPLQLGNSSSAQVGDPVVAIGNPFGLDRTVTTGIVSALQRKIEAPNGFSIEHVIQTDAAIN